MRHLTDDEHRLLALIGNDEVTMQDLVQDSRRNNLVPSVSFHNLLQASLRSGIVAGRRDGNYQYFRNNIGNCKDIAPNDYFRWIPCFIHSPLRHR
jgi:hypothetical protein